MDSTTSPTHQCFIFEHFRVGIIPADEGLEEVTRVLWILFSWQLNYGFQPNLIMGCSGPGSFDYRSLSQLQDWGVLVVGAGNSGSEIALETARRRPTRMSGRHPGHIPFRIEGRAARLLLVRLVLRVLFHRVLTAQRMVEDLDASL